ncbi:hypothetical protein JCM3765_006166 [Sporobolomyces pararoseus]
MAAIRHDQNIPLSQEEQDLPHCIFLERPRYEQLEQEVEALEANPIPLETLHPHFIQTFPLYAALYTRKPNLKDPFCIEGFLPILAAARARADPTLPFWIILIVLACLKAWPNDQLPLDPAARGPTAVKTRRGAAIMENLFQMMVATIEVLCPCGGDARDARSERRGINPQSQPNEPVYQVSRLFTRAVVACLKYDNVEIDHAYAEGAWAATMTKVKTQREAIDLRTLPKRSPILECDVYSNFHPRAILRDLLPFPRSIHLCLTALAYSDQLAKKPHLPQIPFRRIYDALFHVNQDDQYPIGGFDWLMNEIGKNENDPIQDIVQGLLDARAEYEENGGLYISATGGAGCGAEAEASVERNHTIKYQSLLLYESGEDPSTLDIQQVARIANDRQNRIELIHRYNVAKVEVDKLTPQQACSQVWLRHKKLYLERQNIDISGLKDSEINPLLHETAARCQLIENGYLNVESMSTREVNKTVDLLRVTIYLENAGIDTTGMDEAQIRSTRFSQVRGIPQVERLIACLDDEDDLVPPIPPPDYGDDDSDNNNEDNDHDETPRPPVIDPNAPLSSYVTETTAHQFYESVKQSNFLGAGSVFGAILSAFTASLLFRLIQYFPLRPTDGRVSRSRGCKGFGGVIDRAICRRWIGKQDSLEWIRTTNGKDCTAKGANRIVMRRWKGWIGAFKAHKIRLVLTDEIPEELKPHLLPGLAASPWMQKGMRCGQTVYLKENAAEMKWFALFFTSNYWDLVPRDEEDSEVEEEELGEEFDEDRETELEQGGAGGADNLGYQSRPRKAKEESAAREREREVEDDRDDDQE